LGCSEARSDRVAEIDSYGGRGWPHQAEPGGPPAQAGKFMRFFFACMLAVAALAALFGRVARSQVANLQEGVWFALSEADPDKLTLDAIAAVRNGRLEILPDDCYENDPGYKEFVREYLQPRQAYAITFRGTQAGRATIEKESPPWLNGALARYDGPILIRGEVMALASNVPPRFKNADLSRYATPTEEAAVLEVAKTQFAQAGLPQPLVRNVHSDEVLVEYLDRSMQPTFVASVFVEQGGEGGRTHSLFLIAAQKGRHIVPQFVWSKISRGEKDNQTLQFVDFADLLGDGQYEMVLRLNYSENYRYRILRRTKNKLRWEQIFQTPVLGCGPPQSE
jgi:hypothetical protein